MLEKELSFADLSISLSELYEAMGVCRCCARRSGRKRSPWGAWTGGGSNFSPILLFSYPVESWMNRKTRFLSAIRVSV